MELELGEAKGFSDKEEEEEEDISRNTPSSSNYTDFLPHHHANQWQTACSTSNTTANHHNHQYDHDSASRSYNQIAPAEAINFIDLSLKIDTDHSLPDGSSGGGSSDQPVLSSGFEREHMFDKVVTPSDVGKLNRLVIPKQHAERYFPLDSSTNEKGLILNFEDLNGKSWRFRYSYWNSSQSYVMTKGWSRFVKEKKLNAGDVVSFQRGAGELRKDRLFIDWRRRPDTPPVPPLYPLSLHHLQSFRYNWGGNYNIRQYMGSTNSPSSGQLAPLPFPRYGDIYPSYNHYHQNYDFAGRVSRDDYNVLNFGSRSMYGTAPMVIESVPAPLVSQAHGKSSSSSSGHANIAAKRLRLFGVNMDCAHVNEEGSSAGIGCHDDMLYSTTSIPHQFMTTLPLLSSAHDDQLPPVDHNDDLQSRLSVNQSEFPRRPGKAANAASFDWMINPSP